MITNPEQPFTPTNLAEWLVAMDEPASTARRTVTLNEIVAAAKEALATREKHGPGAEKWAGETVHIAYCPEHGLHGARDVCFECGKPVEQIPMRVFKEDES
jgi:hypothetical protein